MSWKWSVVGDLKDKKGMTYLVVMWLDWMMTQGFSEATLESRREYINIFLNWCYERNITKPTQVTKEIMEKYKRHLYRYRKKDKKPLSVSTQRTRLLVVKAFFKYLGKSRHILYDPTADMTMPRDEQRLPRNIMNTSEVEQVLNSIDVESMFGIRDRAMLETLYSCGIRRKELINLKVNDVDMSNGTVMIRLGKGKKDRVVPIGERALAWIDKYLLEVRPFFEKHEEDETMFLSKHGHPISKCTMSGLVRRYIKKAEIGKSGSCHCFRHTCATAMLENGADIRYVQEMLGHAKLETTQVYTKVSISKLKEVHARTHPARLSRDK